MPTIYESFEELEIAGCITYFIFGKSIIDAPDIRCWYYHYFTFQPAGRIKFDFKAALFSRLISVRVAVKIELCFVCETYMFQANFS